MTTKNIPAGQLCHGHCGQLLTIEGSKDSAGQSMTLHLHSIVHSSGGVKISGSCLGEYVSRDLDARKFVILTDAPEPPASDFTQGV